MIRKIIFYTVLLVLTLVKTSYSQSSTSFLKGIVVTIDGKPLSYATVKLENTNFSTSVDQKGDFSIKAPIGDYLLIVTYANYTVHEQPITLVDNETLLIDTITIQSDSRNLREVIVSDIQKNKFAKKETEGPSRMPLGNLQNAQTYSVATKELFQELGALNYNTALAQTAGIVAQTGINDNGNTIYLRGFPLYRLNRNGLPIDTRIQTEIFNLEKIEVIKGPSATLFGAQASSYGGVVNNVTKKPFESFRGDISYTTGAWGLNRITTDINTPLNKDRTALARINILGSTENGFQDAGKTTSVGIASSILFKANERTNVRFDAEVLQSQKPLRSFIRNASRYQEYKSMKDLPLPYDRAFYSNDITTPRSNVSINAELEYKISDTWTSKTSYLFNQSGDKNSIFLVPTYVSDNELSRTYLNFDSYIITYNTLQQNFNGSYRIGNINNQILLGAEYSLFSNSIMAQEPWFTTYDIIDINAPYWQPMTHGEINRNRAVESIGSSHTESESYTISGYISNVTNFYDRIFLMLSARINNYNENTNKNFNPGTPANPVATYNEVPGYKQTNISPKIGLVYQIIKNQVSLYGNYANSFRNNRTQLGYTNIEDFNEGKPAELIKFEPETANQWEIGAKFEIMQKKINATISYFDISVANTVRPLGGNMSIQDGKTNSKGIELEVIGNPLKGLNIAIGYLYNDSKYIVAADNLIGKRPIWTPKNTANTWISYKFLDGNLKGIGAGVGMKHVGQVTFSGSNDFYIPANTVYNATTFYDQTKYRIALTLNNLTNEKYWDFGTKPQKPFEFLVNLSFKF